MSEALAKEILKELSDAFIGAADKAIEEGESPVPEGPAYLHIIRDPEDVEEQGGDGQFTVVIFDEEAIGFDHPLPAKAMLHAFKTVSQRAKADPKTVFGVVDGGDINKLEFVGAAIHAGGRMVKINRKTGETEFDGEVVVLSVETLDGHFAMTTWECHKENGKYTGLRVSEEDSGLLHRDMLGESQNIFGIPDEELGQAPAPAEDMVN